MGILVVDDEESLREIILFELESRGLPGIGVANGEEALEILKKEEVDVVVTDIRMPVMNGIALLEKIKEKNPLVPPVILMTGYRDITKKIAYAKGADCLIEKPFDLDSLIEVILESSKLKIEKWKLPCQKEISSILSMVTETVDYETSSKNPVIFGRGGAYLRTNIEKRRL